jgi:hypothetical protein
MNNLIAIGETATRDHLVRAFALIAVGMLVTRLLFKRYPIGRTVARIVFLFLLTVLLLRQGIVPYQPIRATDAFFRDAIEGTLKIAWWLWGTFFWSDCFAVPSCSSADLVKASWSTMSCPV